MLFVMHTIKFAGIANMNKAQPMTRQELINYCLPFPAAREDYPFAEIPGDVNTVVMRHGTNKKSFVMVINHNGKLLLNLKYDPLETDFLRHAFEGVIPGWYINKEHRNSVIIGTNVPKEEIKRQIGSSYDLVRPKEEL